MYRPTDPQAPVFVSGFQLPASAQKALERSWASGFRKHLFPLLLQNEERFAALYDQYTGRPNWSAARMAGLCIIQDWFDMTDRALEEALCFDIRLQHALDLCPDEAYLSRRSLSDFRLRLVIEDPEMKILREVFDAITEEAIKSLGLSIGRQRLDSTHITSNIRVRGREDLFRRTLRHFVKELADKCPEGFKTLSKAVQQWHLGEESGESSWFGKGGSRIPLQQLAQWAVDVGFAFSNDQRALEWESYFSLARLVAEYCVFEEVTSADPSPAKQRVVAPVVETGRSEPATSENPDDDSDDEGPASPTTSGPTTPSTPIVEGVLKGGRNGGSSLQSPHDPDAGYGHKGKGYSVHITETCDNPESPELITDFEVRSAADNDWGKSTPVLQRLNERNRAPDVLFADAGYPTPASLVDAEEVGVALRAPVNRHGGKDEVVGLEAFEFDDQGCVITCPRGHAPTHHATRREPGCDVPEPHAYFDGNTCRVCPLNGECVARGKKTGRFHVRIASRMIARDLAVQAQKEPAWWQEYSTRSGIEATNSELKRGHGMDHLRVRRGERVAMRVALKIIACNTKRWLRGRQAIAVA